MYDLKSVPATLLLVLSAPLVLAAGDHAHGHHDDQGDTEQSHGHAGHGGHAGHAHGGWVAPAQMAQRRNPIAANAESLERGRRVFVTTCATCHGQQGQGDGPAAVALVPKPANLVAMAPQHTDGDFAWRIATGRGAMPAWENVLSKNQIWDVVNYIKALPTLVTVEAPGEISPAPVSHHEHSGHAHNHD